MLHRRKWLCYIASFVFLTCECKLMATCDKGSFPIIHTLRSMKPLVGGCFANGTPQHWVDFLTILLGCFKSRSLRNLDYLLNRDVIHLWTGAQLVKVEQDNTTLTTNGRMNYESMGETAPGDDEWSSQVVRRIEKVLENHVLRIHLGDNAANKIEGRKRHHNELLPLFVFATVALGMVLVPMGFQFLAVLGGKALLLAKMALLLTSIQGLKKIATSDLNYGFYQAPPQYNNNYNNRQWRFDGDYKETDPRDRYYDFPDELQQEYSRYIDVKDQF